jgi:hypothetical protein
VGQRKTKKNSQFSLSLPPDLDHARVRALTLAVDDVEVGQELGGVHGDERSKREGDGAAHVAEAGHGGGQGEDAGTDDG